MSSDFGLGRSYPRIVAAPPRNLILCFDGTNCQFGEQSTNVIRLIQSLDRNPQRQLVYYDPGVGTLPEPGVRGRLGKWLSKVWGLAFGAGLMQNVEEGYVYLMNTYQPGDRVFFFGFSRGAYTARVLAGLLHALGLLPCGCENLIPYVTRLYRTSRYRKTDSRRGKQLQSLCDQFRSTFARETDDAGRRFRTHFMGLWDTVTSVGWVWNPTKFPFSRNNPSVLTARHAIAIDERRWLFRQNEMTAAAGQDLKQLWFAGDHCDVGGGHPEEAGGLWREPFEWMLAEAESAGLLTEADRLDYVLTREAPPTEPWNEPQHESLSGAWWIAEFIPKWISATDKVGSRAGHKRPGAQHRRLRIGLGRRRYIANGSGIHRSVLQRIQSGNYAPRNLSRSFLDSVKNTHVHVACESLPFDWHSKVAPAVPLRRRAG